jgi:Z1 domain
MDTAIRLVLNLFPDDSAASRESIVEAAKDVHALLARRAEHVPEVDEIVREVEARINVWQDSATTLEDQRGHREWLATRRAEIDWRFWSRYRQYLEDVKLMPRRVIYRLDEVSDSILRKLEDPTRPDRWDRRGLVVGQVQSGKTSNYTGLVCKAADAGYKLVLVLAGIHNSLRSQTQLRLDEGFLGFDSQYQHRNDQQESQNASIGAGLLKGFPRLWAASLTTSAETGDFRTAKARSLALPIGDYPVILVVKKHKGILENIRRWVTTMHGMEDPSTGRLVVRDIPLLMIDDEADNASINTGPTDPDTDPTVINRAIRSLLDSFDKSAYVGYTATPFANIYIDPSSTHEKYGEDLFPRSFIESLRPPTNYLGPTRVFGLAPPDDGTGEAEPTPIHRNIDDHEGWIPDRHRKDWIPPGDLPDSLKEAIHAFVLACAVRRARDQVDAHNSMLIHVTRFQRVQARVSDQVAEYVHFLRDRIRYGDGAAPSPIMEELQELWENDFVPTSDWFPAEEAAPLEWGDIVDEILPTVSKIEVRTLNGNSKDALEYYEYRREGLYVIAIGGNKLSRGLTLEGLTVSYYLRTSRMYDTLMQMGRWFGFRPGYEDVCRLYTTPELRSWYREITQASEELRQELEEMALQGATPEAYGLRVRTSAAGLTITAPNKMRRAQKVRLSFSESLPETVVFDIRRDVLDRNLSALGDFITELDRRSPGKQKGRSNIKWQNTPGEVVVGSFLDGYVGASRTVRARPELIAAYIRQCLKNGELDDWTVVVVSNQQTGSRLPLAGYDVGLTTRECLDPAALKSDQRYAIRRVLSPSDEWLDLDDNQYEDALQETIERYERDPGRRKKYPEIPSGPALRQQRRPGQALLLIYVLNNQDTEHVASPMVGFAVSFPRSAHSVETEYAVNDIWTKLRFDDWEANE